MANEQNLSPQGYNINEAPYNANPSTWEGGGSGGGGGSLPDGGTTGQVLTKRSNNDGDADWQNVPQELPPYATHPSLEWQTPHILTANMIEGSVNKQWLHPTDLKLSQSYSGSNWTEGMLLQSDGNGGFGWRDKEIPDGGTAGQVLTKYGDGDGEADWQDIPSGGGSLPEGGTTGQVLTKYGDGDGEANWQDIQSEAKSLTWVGDDEYPEVYSNITSENQIRRTTAELQAWKQDEYEVALPYNDMLIDNVAGNTVTDDQSGSTISVEIVPVTSPYTIWDDQTETEKKYGLMKRQNRIAFGVGNLNLSSDEMFLGLRGKSNDNIENISIGMGDADMNVWSTGYSITGTCVLNYDAGGVDYHKNFNLTIRNLNIPLTTANEYKKLIAI